MNELAINQKDLWKYLEICARCSHDQWNEAYLDRMKRILIAAIFEKGLDQTTAFLKENEPIYRVRICQSVLEFIEIGFEKQIFERLYRLFHSVSPRADQMMCVLLHKQFLNLALLDDLSSCLYLKCLSDFAESMEFTMEELCERFREQPTLCKMIEERWYCSRRCEENGNVLCRAMTEQIIRDRIVRLNAMHLLELNCRQDGFCFSFKY